ncbi:hypothetical protein F5878DRAFT_725989 [Lentinula raphanica]|uniref:Uncharacterized protein n=1 Tax=Lentinula raphanica TaxID=153919 RepID=A0AA38P758_9AGAR|nr:hypothetical protein F5878DRAFT_725989 [Lentinula raphanica]
MLANEAIHAEDLQAAQAFINQVVGKSPPEMHGDIERPVLPVASENDIISNQTRFETIIETLHVAMDDVLCELPCVTGHVVGVAISLGLSIGYWLYTEREQSEQAEALKDAIGRCAAFRLFAQSTLNRHEVSAVILDKIKYLINYYNPETFKSHLNDLIADFEANQEYDFKQKAFTELQEQDKNVRPSTDTSEDPKTLDELVKIFGEMAKKVKQ